MGAWDKLRGLFGARKPPYELDEDPERVAPDATPEAYFTAEAEALTRTMPGVCSVERVPGDFALRVTTARSNDLNVFLGNIFAETRELSPEERAKRLRFFLGPLTAPEPAATDFAEARERLVPLVRGVTLFADVPMRAVQRRFAPFLIECVGLDSAQAFQYVTAAMVETWGVADEDVFAAAGENAAAHFGHEDVVPYDAEAPYPMWCVGANDTYESSRLLVPGWLAAFEGKVKGRPVAIVPERAALIVGGDGDERCLRRLVESARREYEVSRRSISPALYTVDEDGRVVPLHLPADHPLALAVAEGHVMIAAIEHASQKRALDKRPEDVFVASFTVMKRRDGSLYSYSTWAKGVLTLLPRTDQVTILTDPKARKGEILEVPWDALVGAAGDCLVPEPEMDPPRWRTARWPDDATLARLRSAALVV